MRVHLVNPSDVAFGVAVITPRWLYVLAAATPAQYGTPHLVDETLQQLNLDEVHAGDVVGISIHTANALRGYEVGTLPGIAARMSCTAASTRRCNPTNPDAWRRMPSSRATAS